MNKNFNYRIGLDIGIASVGWAVVAHDNNDEPIRIVDLGVRVFDPCENPKDGTSLAVDRRAARGNRRRLRRRAYRIEKARNYLIANLLNNNEVKKEHNLDVYYLRSKGLDERLTDEELYYLIIHFVKHRGFKSNRKSEMKSESGKVNKATSQNKEKLIALGYRTFGEMIYKYDDPEKSYFKINKNGNREYFVRNHNNYENCFARVDLLEELRLILQSQQKLGNAKITDQFIDDVIAIFDSQRGFDEGPNEPSPYKSNFKVGTCTFEPNEKRAPKGTFSFEYYNALQAINNLSFYNQEFKKQRLSDNEKKKVIDKLLRSGEVKYSDVRTILNLPIECRFVNVSYKAKKAKGDKPVDKKPTLEEIVRDTESKKLASMEFTKQYSKILGQNINKEDKDLYNIIGYILSMRKGDDRRRNLLSLNYLDDNLFANDNISDDLVNALKRANLTPDQIEKIIELEPKTFGNLSLKAIDKITPYLEQGLTYDKACECAGYDFNKSGATKKVKIEWNDLTENGTNELQEITSPVVLRSVSQTIKVINAIIDKYGSPCAIYVELARDMAMDYKRRKDTLARMDNRAQENEKLKTRLQEEFGIPNPNGQDIIKLRLYEEQDGKSAYSLKSFASVLGSVNAVFDNNNTQIDHIMPYSKCFDDSLNNKVLVLSNENQEKGNRVPKEYIPKSAWEDYEVWVTNNVKFSDKKKNNLLRETSNIEDNEELNNRALNDTKQASKFVLNMLNNHLIFKESRLSKKPVIAVNGSITAYLRKIWGINKIRFENDKHHAIDACVVACANDSTIQKITKYEQYKSIERAKEKSVLVIEGDHYTDRLTGEVISKSDYKDKFLKWEEEYDNLNGKMNLITRPYITFTDELLLRANLGSEGDFLTEHNKQELIRLGYDPEEVENIRPIFVSRMPTRKVLGAIHEETIKSSRLYTKENPKLIKSVSLDKLKLDKRTQEIENYATFAKQSDPLLYATIRARLIEHDGDVKAAFKEPVYKPIRLKDGTLKNGNIVRKVKIEETASDYVTLDENTHKVADKGGMVRIDVFRKNGKNYVVPVYTTDVYKQTLPNIAVPYKNNDVMDDKDFLFSLYKNDLVYMECFNDDFTGHYVESKSENSGKEVKIKKGFFYYIKTGIGNASIAFINQDKSITFAKSILNVDVIEKYTVDILGNYTKVKHETRQPLCFKRKK